MNRTNGKIAEKSKEEMGKALLKCLNLYDFGEITVTQIAQEAKLSRRTFYRLFSSKEKLLVFLFESWFQEFFLQVKERDIHHYWDVVKCYFDFCEERKSLLFLLKQQNILNPFFDHMYQNSLQVMEYVHTKEKTQRMEKAVPYLLAYSVGGMFCMLIKWVDNDMDEPSDKLIELLKRGYTSPRF